MKTIKRRTMFDNGIDSFKNQTRVTKMNYLIIYKKIKREQFEVGPTDLVRMLKPHFEPNRAFCDTSMTFGTHLV